jgi:hypothetical protein
VIVNPAGLCYHSGDEEAPLGMGLWPGSGGRAPRPVLFMVAVLRRLVKGRRVLFMRAFGLQL